MLPDWILSLGALQLMQLLHELHRRGYQKLRWFSYMAPNGCALRCHITIQDNICFNQEVMSLLETVCIGTSTGQPDSGENGAEYADRFLSSFPELSERGKGADAIYADWFSDVLKSAKRKHAFPIFYGDWWSTPIGRIKLGDKTVPGPPMRLRLISWNIDGIKAKFDSLLALVKKHDPDVICLQKVKDSKCSKSFDIEGYQRVDSVAAYAGVTTFYKNNLITNDDNHLKSTAVLDGHLLRTEFRFPHFTLYNVYVPYSNPKVPGAVQHRREFDKALFDLVHSTPDRVVICGDMNIVATDWDCWDGKSERNQANFLGWERDAFNRLVSRNALFDTFRSMNSFTKQLSYFFRNDPVVREKNHGHRIDYCLASLSFLPVTSRAEIIEDVTVSTNNPILFEFSF